HRDTRRLAVGRHSADLAETCRRLGQTGPIRNAQHLLTYFQESDPVSCALRLILAKHYLGARNPAQAALMMREAPQGDNVGAQLRAEKDFLSAQMAFLEGKNALAAENYERIYREFNSVNGMAFKCMLHSMVIKALVDIPVMRVDRKIYLNAAVSRKERMQFAFMTDKIPEDYGRKGVPTESAPPESLEDFLVHFVRSQASESPQKTAGYLAAGLRRFPAATFERHYLEFLLSRFKEEKRI